MDELKRERRNRKSQLTRTLNCGQKLIIGDDIDRELVDTQLKKAEQLFVAVEETHEKIVSLIPDDEGFTEAEDWMVTTEESYWQAITTIRAKLRSDSSRLRPASVDNATACPSTEPSVSPSTDPSVNSSAEPSVNSSQGQSSTSEIPVESQPTTTEGHDNSQPTKYAESDSSLFETLKLAMELPKVDMPYFYGDPGQYFSFVNSFKVLISGKLQCEYTKLQHLLKFCKGKALNAINACEFEGESGFSKALEILRVQFGQSHMILGAMTSTLERRRVVDSAESLWELIGDLKKCQVTLSKLGYVEDLNCSNTMLTVQNLLPIHIQTSWSRASHDLIVNQSKVGLVDFIQFLERQASVSSTMFGKQLQVNIDKRSKRFDSRKAGNTKFDNKASYHASSVNDSKPAKSKAKEQNTCVCCTIDTHMLWKCSSFLKMNVDERWDCASRNRLCFKCLGNHYSINCNKDMRCNIDGCRKDHNRLLHRITEGESGGWRQNTASVSANQGSRPTPRPTFHSGGLSNEEISLRVIPIIVSSTTNGKAITANAFLDDGSQQTYVNEDLMHELGIEGIFEEVHANLLNGKEETFLSFPAKFNVASLDDPDKTYMVEALTTKHVCGDLKAVDWSRVSKDWSHLQNIKFPSFNGDRKKVDILIGLDHAELHESILEVKGRSGEPVARLTPLGYTCVGVVAPTRRVKSFHTRTVSTFHCNTVADNRVDDTLRKFWEVDNSGLDNKITCYTKEEEAAVTAVTESMTKDCDTGRYQVNIPWKEDEKLKLSTNNYQSAKNRLESLERKLMRDEKLGEAYRQVIDSNVDKGYIRKVPENEKKNTKWFIPHFPVVKMDRSTTKVRIVYDAAAQSKGLCLNDVINNGPKLQNDLFDVLIRFRRERIAIVCDISEMYMQIQVHEIDRSMLRFMWRNLDRKKSPDVYEFCRLIFGLNVSPFIAQKVSQENAKSNKEQFPMAAETVLESTYMDDSMDSVKDEETAIQLYKELMALWGKAGMSARKWLSNSKKVLEAIPQEYRVKDLKISDRDWPSVKTLGLTWVADKDVFVFSGPDRSVESMTKRKVLSQIATLFDPLGFLSPIIIAGKILLQEIWSSGVQWDEVIPKTLEVKVDSWVKDLQNLGRVEVPRSILFKKESTSIHVFTDASKDAYAVVAYARNVTSEGAVTVRFIASKTKVAPLKALTIPKLELMGAALGLKLSRSIVSVLKIKLEDVTYWVDSQNVLFWIRGRSKSFKPFVANRVGEIQNLTNPSQWRHVPGKDNPADLASRGTTVTRMVEDEIWSAGPKFLSSDPKTWPKNSVSDVVGSEERKVVVTSMVVMRRVKVPADDQWRLNPRRHDNWDKLCKITGYVFRFINNCRTKKDDRGDSKVLNRDEIQDAEEYLVKIAQFEAFGGDIEDIKKRGIVGPNSALRTMLPKLDEDGVLRMSGRLSLIETLPYDARFPVILPRKHALTRLIVRKYHTEANHVAGTNHILSKISEKYWVIHGREEIRECESSCNQCKLRNAKAGQQVMAPLPKKRVTMSLRAFTKVSVDYAGPFLTVQGRGRVRTKRYLCLFTCLSTRAVHLELAYGLDTDTFLNALYRFVSRRGEPIEMMSDNGTNFIGASRELKEVFKLLDQSKIKELTATKMRWTFIPPLSPHFGGAHEALIKTCKRAIYAILRNADVTDEELHSAFVGAEGIINSRPLTYMSASPKDLTPLTPNHFLHGSMGGNFASEEVIDSTRFDTRKRWRRVQELMRHFWQRWTREWLPSLNQRKKWQKQKPDMKVNDLVLVMEKDVVRGQWPLGRVLEVFPGPDDHVRVLRIKTRRGEIVRNITKVCPLELSE